MCGRTAENPPPKPSRSTGTFPAIFDVLHQATFHPASRDHTHDPVIARHGHQGFSRSPSGPFLPESIPPSPPSSAQPDRPPPAAGRLHGGSHQGLLRCWPACARFGQDADGPHVPNRRYDCRGILGNIASPTKRRSESVTAVLDDASRGSSPKHSRIDPDKPALAAFQVDAAHNQSRARVPGKSMRFPSPSFDKIESGYA